MRLKVIRNLRILANEKITESEIVIILKRDWNLVYEFGTYLFGSYLFTIRPTLQEHKVKDENLPDFIEYNKSKLVQ